jgi:hypothetical protein
LKVEGFDEAFGKEYSLFDRLGKKISAHSNSKNFPIFLPSPPKEHHLPSKFIPRL